MTFRAALALAMLSWGCGGAEVEPVSAPVLAEPATAGDALLALAPAGADAVLEVDVARLRDNAAVGAVVAALGGPGTSADLDLASRADTVLLCAYDIGDAAEQLVLVAGPGLGEIAGARRLGPDTIAVGPEALIARAEAVRGGHEPSAFTQSSLLALRGAAMPDGAPGASLRLAAHFDFDARVELSRRLELAEVPTSLSIWGDVVDDLAVVAVLEAASAGEAVHLAEGLGKLRDRLARTPALRHFDLGPELARARIERTGSRVRIVFSIGPRRLEALVGRVLEKLGGGGVS